MNEEEIKKLIAGTYPNAEPFWERNKYWILKLINKVQDEFKLYYSPNYIQCDGCYKTINYVWNRDKFKKGDYNYCYPCMRQKIKVIIEK